jgi:hypothetical protein
LEPFHNEITVEDVTAQEKRCHYYRQRIRDVEDLAEQISGSDPLSSDVEYTANIAYPVYLSGDSLEITSSADDIHDEYKNTPYHIVTMRLKKLILRLQQAKDATTEKKRVRTERYATFGEPDRNSREERILTLQTEKARRQAERRTLRKNRRLRMLAQHGAQLDEKKKVKVVVKNPDDEEEEVQDSDEGVETKKVEPDSIEGVRALLAGERGHFVKLTYKQRWKLKIDEWKQWKDTYEERKKLLEDRQEKALQAEANFEAKDDAEAEAATEQNARKIAVLRSRLDLLNQRTEAITAKIDNRLQLLQARAARTPGRTVLTRKLADTTAEHTYLLGQFYPERLPKEPVKKGSDDDDYDDY